MRHTYWRPDVPIAIVLGAGIGLLVSNLTIVVLLLVRSSAYREAVIANLGLMATYAIVGAVFAVVRTWEVRPSKASREGKR